MKPQPQPVKLLTVTVIESIRCLCIACADPGVTVWAFEQAKHYGKALVHSNMLSVDLYVNACYNLDEVVTYLDSYNEDVHA